MGLGRGGVRKLNTPAGTSRTPSRTGSCTMSRRARWNQYRISAFPSAASPSRPGANCGARQIVQGRNSALLCRFGQFSMRLQGVSTVPITVQKTVSLGCCASSSV
jgi:hypothetical protein